MTLDLAATELLSAAGKQPWLQPESYWKRLTEATKHLSAPVVALGVEALAHNAHDILRRAKGKPVRVASKSIRVRSVLDAVLALPGYRGVLAYTLAEALWLSETIDDIVVAYPTADRAAIAALAADEQAATRIAVMIDSVDQLELIDSVAPPATRSPIRVCLDFDASWNTKLLGSIGALRSPVHEPAELRRLAERVLQRRGFELVGIMSYEAQIAGVGDEPIGDPAKGLMMRTIQQKSAAELADRRAEAIGAVQALNPLEFVNGGGTGSIERTIAEDAITEVAVGSGLFGPHLFDNYRSFTPAPAVAFALDVVRRPNRDTATLLGGGWIASGVAGQDRLPQVVHPAGLSYAPREGAGEVQSPLIGKAARRLSVGDRVWLRHTKSGEIMEHTNEVVPVLVDAPGDGGSSPLETMLSYRGEGKCFL
ncbi:MAG: alanine racemase [Actinobacteria bacterium]|nr:alanine racemase [Actinomycetota bacterium]